jgi:hypothetical protein
MAMFSAVFYGCLAMGSLLWGQIATWLNLADALLLASGGALIVLIFARKLPLRG